MELKKLLVKALVCSSVLILGCNVFRVSNSSVIEGTYDNFNNSPATQLVKNAYVGGDDVVAYSDIYAQYGVDEDNNYWVRFATAVKGDISSIQYERAAIEKFNETQPIVKQVNSVYASVVSNGVDQYYNVETGLSADESDKGNYYWACYSIKIVNPEYYSTSISMSFKINDEVVKTRTTSLSKLMLFNSGSEYVTLGSYPTNKVTDESLVSSLTEQLTTNAPTAAGDNWKAYTHWFGWDSSKSKAVAKTDALYQDITYQGSKYRAVYFNSELPKNCSQSYSSSNQYQQTNGYNKQTLYFFDYQPLKWKVVAESDSHYTLVASKILDGTCYTHDGAAGYVGAYNDIRLFTENSFFNWAFSETEKELLTEVTFKNDKTSGNVNDSADLTKKVSIPSKAEIEQYFKTADERKKTTTDYAKLNGVQVNSTGQAYWWSRSRAASNPYRLTPGGSFDSAASGYFSSAGILPQIYIAK